MAPKLSILIPTVPERELEFNMLTTNLNFQRTILADGLVEIIANDNPKDKMSIGAKRQALLERARGEYVVFFDDDDLPMYNYIERILKALESKPDCVALTIPYLLNGLWVGTCYHSMSTKEWHQVEDSYYRGITPNNPVKRELALQAGFNDLRFGEDQDYSKRVTPLCKTQILIPQIIYFYTTENKTPRNIKYGISNS